MTIEIPNSFWIRGQGLEVQLAGDLRTGLRDGVPRVVGELRALSGQLEVVGARLQLDRGLVTFYGGDTTNPSLDLELEPKPGRREGDRPRDRHGARTRDSPSTRTRRCPSRTS